MRVALRRSYSYDLHEQKGAVEIGAFLFYHDLAKKRAFSSVVERSVHIGEVAGPIPATPTKENQSLFRSDVGTSTRSTAIGFLLWRSEFKIYLRN